MLKITIKNIINNKTIIRYGTFDLLMQAINLIANKKDFLRVFATYIKN